VVKLVQTIEPFLVETLWQRNRFVYCSALYGLVQKFENYFRVADLRNPNVTTPVCVVGADQKILFCFTEDIFD
jgi:hypothetical protein